MNEVDYFAGLAMQSLIKLQLESLNADCSLDEAICIISVKSYDIAASMMEVRKRRDIPTLIDDNEELCPKCKHKDRPDYNCDLCEGFGYINMIAIEEMMPSDEFLNKLKKQVYSKACKTRDGYSGQWGEIVRKESTKIGLWVIERLKSQLTNKI